MKLWGASQLIDDSSANNGRHRLVFNVVAREIGLQLLQKSLILHLDKPRVIGQDSLLIKYNSIPMLLADVAVAALLELPLHTGVLLEEIIFSLNIIFYPLIEY